MSRPRTMGDVDEEVSPGAGGVVGGVDVQHGGGFL
jgi:hypothetical protein